MYRGEKVLFLGVSVQMFFGYFFLQVDKYYIWLNKNTGKL